MDTIDLARRQYLSVEGEDAFVYNEVIDNRSIILRLYRVRKINNENMAFMMPVMKNEFDIYKGRQRRVSECSNNSNCRSRKVSEGSRSDCPSLSTSPGNEFMAGSPSRHRSHPMYMSHLASRPQFSRNSSRTSQSSLITSPSKASASSSPPKPASTESQSSLNKFHTRLVDKLRKSLRKSKSTEGRS